MAVAYGGYLDRRYRRALEQPAQNLFRTLLATAVALPIFTSCTDLPPRGEVPPVANRTITQNLLTTTLANQGTVYGAPGQVPTVTLPNPSGRPAGAVGNRTQTQSLVTTTLATADTAPVVAVRTELPPRAKPAPVQNRTFTASAPLLDELQSLRAARYGLWAAWRLDDLTDSYDARHFTINNGGATFAAGKIGNAVYLDRDVPQSLQTEPVASPGDTDFMVAAWVWLDSLTGTQTILVQSDSSEYPWDLYYDTSRFRFYIESLTDTSEVAADTFGAPTTGAWNLVVALHDSTNDLISISVNGGPWDSVAHTTGAQTDVLRIGLGEADGNVGESLEGRVDAAYVFRSPPGGIATLKDEIRDWLYDAGRGREYPEWVIVDVPLLVGDRTSQPNPPRGPRRSPQYEQGQNLQRLLTAPVEDQPYGKPSVELPPRGRAPLNRGMEQAGGLRLAGQDAVYAGPGQVPTQAWPNPPPGPDRKPQYEQGPNLQPLLGLAAATLPDGEASFDLPPRGRAPINRGQVQSGGLRLAGQDTIHGAAGQAEEYAWPNPRGPLPGSIANRSHLTNGTIYTQPAVGQSTVLPPRGRQPLNRGLTQAGGLRLAGQDQVYDGPGRVPTYPSPLPPSGPKRTPQFEQGPNLQPLLAAGATAPPGTASLALPPRGAEYSPDLYVALRHWPQITLTPEAPPEPEPPIVYDPVSPHVQIQTGGQVAHSGASTGGQITETAVSIQTGGQHSHSS